MGNRLIAQVPASVYTKLLAPFLTMVVLLIAVCAMGLTLLSAAHGRRRRPREVAAQDRAYRQLQNDTTAQFYSVAWALLVVEGTSLGMLVLKGFLKPVGVFSIEPARATVAPSPVADTEPDFVARGR